MNQEIFVNERKSEWDCLYSILKKVESQGIPSLSSLEVEQLARLYRKVTSDLAYSRSKKFDQRVVDFLNNLVGKAHPYIYAPPPATSQQIKDFFVLELPSLFRRKSRLFLFSFLIFLASALLSFWIGLTRPEFQDLFLPEQLVEELEGKIRQRTVGEPFPDAAKPLISSFILTNNIQVSLLAFASGIFLGLGTLYVLIKNGLLLGALASVFTREGEDLLFWSLILPHGILELTAIFLAATAGFLLGSAFIVPGDLSYRDALTVRAHEAIKLVMGTIPLLMVAAAIEGFLTPAPLPPLVKLLFSFLTPLPLFFWLRSSVRRKEGNPVR